MDKGVSKLVSYFVVSPSRQVRIPCDGPLDAQHAKQKLEEEMKHAGLLPDVEIKVEAPKKPLPRAHPQPKTKRSTKLRYK